MNIQTAEIKYRDNFQLKNPCFEPVSMLKTRGVLPPGGHTLRMEVSGMPRRAYLQLTEMIVYVEEQ